MKIIMILCGLNGYERMSAKTFNVTIHESSIEVGTIVFVVVKFTRSSETRQIFYVIAQCYDLTNNLRISYISMNGLIARNSIFDSFA